MHGVVPAQAAHVVSARTCPLVLTSKGHRCSCLVLCRCDGAGGKTVTLGDERRVAGWNGQAFASGDNRNLPASPHTSSWQQHRGALRQRHRRHRAMQQPRTLLQVRVFLLHLTGLSPGLRLPPAPFVLVAVGQRTARQAEPASPCCSEFGWCGLDAHHCSFGCRSGSCWTLDQSREHLGRSLPLRDSNGTDFDDHLPRHSRRMLAPAVQTRCGHD